MSAPGDRYLGFLAGLALKVFGRKRNVTGDDLRKTEFRHSTQRIGLRFTDKLRDSLRRRWLKKI